MESDKPLELHPDPWERFEKAMTVIGKAKPRRVKDRPPPRSAGRVLAQNLKPALNKFRERFALFLTLAVALHESADR